MQYNRISRRLILASVLFAVVSIAHGQATQPVTEPDALKAINLLRTELVDSFNKGDVNRLLSHLDPDVIVTWQNGEVCRGPQAVKAYYERMLVGPNSVLVDVQARSQLLRPRTATLTADSSAPLTSGGATIPFSQFAWTSSAPGGGPNGCLNAPATIPSGVFSATAGQPLISFNTSRRACMCAQFRYLNQSVVSAGTYTGRVTYTLSMP